MKSRVVDADPNPDVVVGSGFQNNVRSGFGFRNIVEIYILSEPGPALLLYSNDILIILAFISKEKI